MVKKILITGANGMLGQELARIFYSDSNYFVTAWDRKELDITNKKEVQKKIRDAWPDIIINAAAYNSVDECEKDKMEYQKAYTLNAEAPGYLAKIAQELQAIFVHYSTDYVFDGERPRYKDGKRAPGCCGTECEGCKYNGPEESMEYFAYREDDEPNPLSNYGKTKLEGERAVAKNTSHYYLVRTSRLFGENSASEGAKQSFFGMMIEKGKMADAKLAMKSKNTNANDEIGIKAINGEVSKFTYARDLAKETKKLLESGKEWGIYHLVNEDACSWYDGVVELFSIEGFHAKVLPVKSDVFSRAAKRPSSSVLLNTKWPKLRSYKDALKEYVEQLNG